jgi:hypothetical protein
MWYTVLHFSYPHQLLWILKAQNMKHWQKGLLTHHDLLYNLCPYNMLTFTNSLFLNQNYEMTMMVNHTEYFFYIWNDNKCWCRLKTWLDYHNATQHSVARNLPMIIFQTYWRTVYLSFDSPPPCQQLVTLCCISLMKAFDDFPCLFQIFYLIFHFFTITIAETDIWQICYLVQSWLLALQKNLLPLSSGYQCMISLQLMVTTYWCHNPEDHYRTWVRYENHKYLHILTYSVALVRKLTIPTERPYFIC